MKFKDFEKVEAEAKVRHEKALAEIRKKADGYEPGGPEGEDADQEDNGFRVRWEVLGGDVLVPEMTPEEGEPPISMEHKAWVIATRIRDSIENAVNIHVVHGKSLSPVMGFRSQMRRPYMPPIKREESVPEPDAE